MATHSKIGTIVCPSRTAILIAIAASGVISSGCATSKGDAPHASLINDVVQQGEVQSYGREDTDTATSSPRRQSDKSARQSHERLKLSQVANEDSGETFDISMSGVPLEQAAQAVLGDTLGVKYELGSGVDGQVTMRTSAPINKSALLDTFQKVLQLNGLRMTYHRGAYHIESDGGRASRTRNAGEASAVYVIPLAFIDVDEMERVLKPMASSSLQIDTHSSRNILFLTGTRSAVSAALDAVNLFDVDAMRGKSVSRIELFSASPAAVAAELSSIFDNKPGGAFEGEVEFVPNDVLGSILVISSNPQFAAEAEKWVQKISDSVRTEVYELKNRNATDLAPTLTSLLNGADADGATASNANIVADDAANAIIVHGAASAHDKIERLISQLDDVADQVLIEATIAEVELNDTLAFGIRHFFETGSGSGGFTNLTTAAVSPMFPGFSAVFEDGDFSGALDALSTITEVNVISSPSLLVLDNREAVLNVGDQVPVVTQTAVSVQDSDSPIVNSVEYRDTGVILTIKPRVDSSGRVILDVDQEVSDVVKTATSEINSPTIQQRKVSTTVAIDDGQSLILGGLIREKRNIERSKVPILGDAPVLGALFRRTDDTEERTELLIVITPTVIRSAADARAITKEYQDKMSGPTSLLRKNRKKGLHSLERILLTPKIAK